MCRTVPRRMSATLPFDLQVCQQRSREHQIETKISRIFAKGCRRTATARRCQSLGKILRDWRQELLQNRSLAAGLAAETRSRWKNSERFASAERTRRRCEHGALRQNGRHQWRASYGLRNRPVSVDALL